MLDDSTVPPNPGHPAFDRPEHYYLVRLYNHSEAISDTLKWPHFIAVHDDYENERFGGAPTEVQAIAEVTANLLDTMCSHLDRDAEKATRTLAAAMIMQELSNSKDKADRIDRLIAQIPDPDSPRGQLQAILWKMLHTVQDHEHEAEVSDFTNAALYNMLDRHLRRWDLNVRTIYRDPPDDAEPEPV